MIRLRLASLTSLALPLLLTGCSLLPTNRKLPMPKSPAVTQYMTADQLVAQVNRRWEATTSLTAKVEFKASVTKTRQGVATDYPSASGNILMRKPADLRVLGRYFGVTAFDMASDGKCFTLSIPHNNKVIKGCGPAKTKSANTWENLRPAFIFDALLVRGLDTHDRYSVVSETETVEDAARKHLFIVPEYVLTISRDTPTSQQLTTERVITFHRDDLRPYQQDIYDAAGNIETEVFYAGYQDFEGSQYPHIITIKRPLEEIQIVLTVDDVRENHPLTDDQFVVKIPDGSKIVNQE